MLLSKYAVGSDGKTAYHRLHGQPIRERLPEFGETVLWYVPRKERSNMDPHWRFGVFLGRSWRSDQNFLALPNGNVTRARAIARTISAKRWQPKRLESLRAVPWSEQPAKQDDIEKIKKN